MRTWYVVRTNVRCEDRAARSLRAERFRVYVPKMRKSVFQRRQRVMTVRHFALFNRYIFVTCRRGAMDWYKLALCDGVESVLGINGKPAPVPDAEVAGFMLAQRRRAFDDVRGTALSGRQKRELAKARFRRGARLKVLAGPFGGYAAHVVDITGQGAIKAMVEIFGRLTPVQFEMDQIEPLDVTADAA